MASALQHPSLTSASSGPGPSPSPASLVSDEHLINRSLLDHLDAHDAIDFPIATRSTPSSSIDLAQSNPGSNESGNGVEKEMNNLIYPPTGAFRPGNGFAAIPAPNHTHPLRHHASASNDVLRGFGPINSAIPEPPVNSAFPQELYSSSATLPMVPPPTSDSSSPPYALLPRSTAGSEYDYPMNGLNGLVASPPQPIINHRPSTNTFTIPPQPSVAAVGTFAPPVLPPNLLQTVSNPPTASLVPTVLSQHPPNGLQTPNPAPMYTAGPPSFVAPTAQLVQILSTLPPQQKNAVIGRLQEMAQGVNTQLPVQSPPGSTGQPQTIPQPPVLFVQPQAQPGGQQEEISTIFVVGFPDDMTEREFQNMFTFCHGYEAATLKVPPKEIPPPTTSNPAVAAAASALAGASDPYNLVTVNSGGVVVDQGNNTTATTSSTWATGLEDPYTRHALAAAAAASSSTSTSELAQQLALAQTTQPRKQIIGFAKFRTKEDALAARDVLHGRRVDIEKGALLKAEMAKKNLHTKRGVGPMQVSLPSGINPNGPPQPGPPATESPTPIPSVGIRPSNGIPQDGDRSMSSSFASLTTVATSTSDGSHGKVSESPTFKLQRLNEIQPFVPGGGPHLMAGPVPAVNEPSAFYSTPPQPTFHRNGIQSIPHQPSLPSLAEGRTTEGFHALPSKPVSDIVKANALPPTNLPPPSSASSIAGSRRAASSRGGDSPPGPESDAGYASDALSTSHMSERSRAESVGRYGGYTPPLSDEPQLHLPPHLLQDDVLGTPQQTDYASKLIEEGDFAATVAWSTSVRPARKITNPSGMAFSPPPNDTNGFIGSSASSAAGSVSSGGADSVSTSTTSGGNANTGNLYPAPHHELGRQRGQTMPSMRSVMNGNGHLSGGEQGRSSAEHPRRGGNAADQNPPINTLYVGNLPTSLTTPQSAKTLEDALVQLFSRAPGYSKLCFRQKNNGPMCFVEFDDVSSASKALGELYGNTLNGFVKGGGIRLSYSKNPLGVRTNVPSNPNKVTSPVQSPTTHAPYQFGSIPPPMQEQQRSAMPMDMPRTGRMRAETMERIHMGPGSSGRYMAASPPNGMMSAFGPIGGFGRGPMNGPPQGPQSFGMAASPPATSPMPASAYQTSASFQPFAQLDLTPQPHPPGNDPGSGI